MSSCPYSDEELQYWDGVANPMGEACNDCDEYECEHNPNQDPLEPVYFDEEMAAIADQQGRPEDENFEPEEIDDEV